MFRLFTHLNLITPLALHLNSESTQPQAKGIRTSGDTSYSNEYDYISMFTRARKFNLPTVSIQSVEAKPSGYQETLATVMRRGID